MFDKAIFKLPHIYRTLATLVLFALMETACILGEAFGLSRGLVALWEGGVFEDALWNLSLFACSFVCVRITLDLREAFISSYALRCARETRKDLFGALFQTGAPLAQRFGTATSAAMALEGIDKMKEYLELVLPKLVNMMVLPFMFALAIACADWVSGVIVIILLPSMVLLMVLIGKTTAEKSRVQHGAFKVMSNHFIDSVRGLPTLSTFVVSKTYADRVYEVSERFREATMKMLKSAQLSGAVLDLFATLAIAAVSIMLGLRLIDGSLTLLPALFVLILAPEFFRPIREYASDYHASLDGVNSLHTIESMIASVSVPPSTKTLLSWNGSSTLKLEGVSQAYEGIPVLSGVTANLKGYARIGVVGTSGSGKSTLLRLLAGLEDPVAGAFVLDERETLTTLRYESWEEQVAYIPQDPMIFHASLRENLTFYNPQATDDRLCAVIKKLGLSELLAQLPHGLDTLIGEGARGLSGGQAQRIALARVVLDQRKRIVLFDEPTAHLDIETEMELKQAMVEVMQGRLVVFATHRLHWLDTLDYLLVLEEGKLVEQGTTAQLLENSTQFSTLVRALRGGEAA